MTHRRFTDEFKEEAVKDKEKSALKALRLLGSMKQK
jgi:hypothetical protein